MRTAVVAYHRKDYSLAATYVILFFKRFHLFIFSEGKGREKQRERNINVWLPLTHPPGMCLRLGIKPVTLWFTDGHSNH